jgi:hypothetical protein
MTCAWEPDPACLGDAWSNIDEDVQQRALILATSSLQALTNNRVGTCPITIRPCPQEPPCGCRRGWNPHIGADGLWYNACCERVYAPLSEVDIPGPVGYIDSMLINGSPVELWNGDWRLDNGHLLVWQGEGDSPIPAGQDLNKPDSENGTWSITYSKSYPVLADARWAMTYLAIEFAKACAPKGKCALPRGVTNVVRNGVSFTIEVGLFPNGLTGIELVDAWILKWNPIGSPTQSAQVFDPAKPKPRITNSVPMAPLPVESA